MGDLLATLGLTTIRPDPALLLNQKQVDNQLGGIRTNIRDTLGSIDLVLKGADVLGVSPEMKGKLETLKTKGLQLVEKTDATPLELEKQRESFDKEFTDLQKLQTDDIDGKKLTDAKGALEKIEARAKDVEEDTTTSPQLLQDYLSLRTRARDMYKTVQLTVEKAREARLKKAKEDEASGVAATPTTKEGFQAEPAAPVETVLAITPQELLEELDALDGKKAKEEAANFDMSRLVKRTVDMTKYVLVLVAILFGALIGGIVAANTYIGEKFWALKLYYFLYGAAFFPFSLLAGLVRPPMWHATLVPLFERAGPAATSFSEWFFSYEPINQASYDARLSGSKLYLRILSGIAAAFGISLAVVYRLDRYIVNGG